MKLLAIDPGQHLGIAVFDAGTLVHYECKHLRKKASDSKGMILTRLQIILEELLAQHSPDTIVYELVSRHIGTHAAHMYGAIEGLLHIIAEKYGLAMVSVPVKHIKKFTTGSGNADKQKMLETANTLYTLELTNDNVADAILIGHTYIHDVSTEDRPT